jgi:hypothetical protein
MIRARTWSAWANLRRLWDCHGLKWVWYHGIRAIALAHDLELGEHGAGCCVVCSSDAFGGNISSQGFAMACQVGVAHAPIRSSYTAGLLHQWSARCHRGQHAAHGCHHSWQRVCSLKMAERRAGVHVIAVSSVYKTQSAWWRSVAQTNHDCVEPTILLSVFSFTETLDIRGNRPGEFPN